MTLRSILSAVVVFGLPVLEGTEIPTAKPLDTEPPPWLAFDLSSEQLEADYERTINAGKRAELEIVAPARNRTGSRSAAMIPIMFLAAAGPEEPPAPAAEEPPADGEGLPEEDGQPVARDAEGDNALGEEVARDLELRMQELEKENELLRARLARWEAVREPVEPFIDPDWPAQPEPRRRFRFRRSPVLPPSLERAMRSPIVALRREETRYKPFTRAAMDTPSSGPLPPEQARSLHEQRQFFRNTTKALGAGVQSREYRGVRLEVEKAMLRGELHPRYAAQYFADIVEVFHTYERLERFGLTGPVAPPVSGESFRRDPDRLFRWASEVKEQDRRMNVE